MSTRVRHERWCPREYGPETCECVASPLLERIYELEAAIGRHCDSARSQVEGLYPHPRDVALWSVVDGLWQQPASEQPWQP